MSRRTRTIRANLPHSPIPQSLHSPICPIRPIGLSDRSPFLYDPRPQIRPQATPQISRLHRRHAGRPARRIVPRWGSRRRRSSHASGGARKLFEAEKYPAARTAFTMLAASEPATPKSSSTSLDGPPPKRNRGSHQTPRTSHVARCHQIALFSCVGRRLPHCHNARLDFLQRGWAKSASRPTTGGSRSIPTTSRPAGLVRFLPLRPAIAGGSMDKPTPRPQKSENAIHSRDSPCSATFT